MCLDNNAYYFCSIQVKCLIPHCTINNVAENKLNDNNNSSHKISIIDILCELVKSTYMKRILSLAGCLCD